MRFIPSFPNYEISEMGIVYNIKTSKKVRQQKGHNKLMTVALARLNPDTEKIKMYQRGVAPLMWETYPDLIGIPEHLEEDWNMLSIVVKHKNGCLWDNRVFNLQIADKRKRGHPYCMRCKKFHLSKELCV